MNVYVMVEGELAAKEIYQKWIPLVNRQLQNIDYPNQFAKNNFYVFFGKGQPEYWSRASIAVDDVNNNKTIDRLVFGFDSEDMSYHDKLNEAKENIEKFNCRVQVKYIVQHFCMETWLLGNKDNYRWKTKNNTLNEYYKKFDVRENDPEDLPAYKEGGKRAINRAAFAYNYLRLAIYDKYGMEKSYSKRNVSMI